MSATTEYLKAMSALAYKAIPDGWTACLFADPPPAPEGYELETKDDGFLGYVVAYRFVPIAEGSE